LNTGFQHHVHKAHNKAITQQVIQKFQHQIAYPPISKKLSKKQHKAKGGSSAQV
jgi:hypothetical protein